MTSTDRTDSRDTMKDTSPASNRNLLWVLCLIAIAVAAFVFFSTQNPGVAKHPAVGRPAPELGLTHLIASSTPDVPAQALEGMPSLTGKPYDGKVTMLHFWGTWCPPCKAEYPHLVELVRELDAEKRFQFISVSCEGGPGETFERLQNKTRKYYESIAAGNLPTHVDYQGITRTSVVEAIGARSMMYPTTLIIDRNQRIAGVWLGYSEASLGEMHTLIMELLK